MLLCFIGIPVFHASSALWSVAAFCGAWYGSTLFTNIHLKYLQCTEIHSEQMPAWRNFASLPLSKFVHWRFWSDWANAETDLNLGWAGYTYIKIRVLSFCAFHSPLFTLIIRTENLIQQCRPRLDANEHGVRSVPTLYATYPAVLIQINLK